MAVSSALIAWDEKSKSALARGFLIPKQRKRWVGGCHAAQLAPSDVVVAQHHGGIGWLLLRALSMRVSISHCTSSQSGKIRRAAVSIPIFQMARLSFGVTRLKSNGSLVGQLVTCSPVLFPLPHTMPADTGPDFSSQATEGAAPAPCFFYRPGI